jgi:hypothetical protein
MGYTHTRTPILRYFSANPSRPITVEEIEKATGLNRVQIQGSIRNIITAGFPVFVIKSGTVWQYIGQDTKEDESSEPQIKVGQIMEIIAMIPGGDKILIKSEDGFLYVAHPFTI